MGAPFSTACCALALLAGPQAIASATGNSASLVRNRLIGVIVAIIP
jgi:hypothetical protein